MYTQEQYSKDLLFLEKIDKLVARKVEFLAYFFPIAACLGAHTLYFILFTAADVPIMSVFNIFSMTFYAAMIFIFKRVTDKVNIVYAAVAEIIAHATTATACVGWIPDFGMLLLMIIPIVFLMPNKNRKIPVVMMIASLLIYASLRVIYRDSDHTIYNIEHTSYAMIFFVINMVIGSCVLVYVTTIYNIMNRYTECKLSVQNEQLRIMASTDPLTKLSNRREISRRLAEISEASHKNGSNYVVGIGDIDFFKKINDTYGHDYGDIVLTKVAEVISSSLPDNGCAARWGGEEFLFVIPDSDLNEGIRYADSMVGAVSREIFSSDGKDFSVTMTIGICEASPDDTVDKAITCADGRLYKGKRNGKNHTEYTD